MFVRIVKMHFKETKISAFITHFNSVRDRVRNQPGCHSLQLLQDKDNPNIFFTYSTWEAPENLDTYRKSEFFKQVWQETKQLFEEKPEAWSVQEVKSDIHY
ncbi:MAG TPA: antibiotic biosynthesis monooxygenase [Saprospiraceae bacterium]|nr:antibiotic biosynthesis monooxygenase [Saprospiraceae bacterium]